MYALPAEVMKTDIKKKKERKKKKRENKQTMDVVVCSRYRVYDERVCVRV